jgi:tripartite-type tricarboxylate transporter receptor subunit TctC
MVQFFRVLLPASCLMLFIMNASAWAQSYPARPVRLVVPFAAGGSTDIVGRLLSEKLREGWGQSVIVDNRGGAGGLIGSEIVARALPDGYTLLLASGSIMTAHKYMYKLPFDPQKAFLPITNIVRSPQVVMVANALPVRSVKELVDFANSKPDSLRYGSAGVGSQIHLGAEMLLFATRVGGIHVPFGGGGPALAALASGEIQLLVPNLPSGITLLKSGRARAIAVTGKKRSEQLPDVATVAETIPGFESEGWFGLIAPAGTPSPIVKTIHAATIRILADPLNKPRFESLGMLPVGNSISEFSEEIRSESGIWEKVVRERKLMVR